MNTGDRAPVFSSDVDVEAPSDVVVNDGDDGFNENCVVLNRYYFVGDIQRETAFQFLALTLRTTYL